MKMKIGALTYNLSPSILARNLDIIASQCLAKPTVLTDIFLALPEDHQDSRFDIWSPRLEQILTDHSFPTHLNLKRANKTEFKLCGAFAA